MKKHTLEYIGILFAVLVLGITILWFYRFVLELEQNQVTLKRNLYETVLDVEVVKKGKVQSEEIFLIPQSGKIYVDYYQGKNIEKYLKRGNLKIVDSKNTTVFEIDLSEKYHKDFLQLSAGEYKIVEDIELQPNPITNISFEEYREKAREERKADGYFLQVLWLQF